jgi:hypothetical protein
MNVTTSRYLPQSVDNRKVNGQKNPYTKLETIKLYSNNMSSNKILPYLQKPAFRKE